jgi:hypothetical protein
VEERGRTSPPIRHRLGRRLAVDVHDDGVLPRRIERPRLEHVAVQRHPLPDRHLDEFHRGRQHVRKLRLKRRGIRQPAQRTMVGQRDDLHHWHAIE